MHKGQHWPQECQCGADLDFDLLPGREPRKKCVKPECGKTVGFNGREFKWSK